MNNAASVRRDQPSTRCSPCADCKNSDKRAKYPCLYLGFIGLQKTYHSVDRELLLWEVLAHFRTLRCTQRRCLQLSASSTTTACRHACVRTMGETRRHTFADLRASALAIRQVMPTPTQPGSARNIGILAGGGGFALYASWLAVLWEGCAVVPLSAETPTERLASTVEDAAVEVVVVTDEGGAAAGTRLCTKETCSAVLILDVRPLQALGSGSPILTGSGEPSTANDEEEEEEEEKESAVVCQNAYIYYTSGSSGEPKGVFSGHAPMMNRLRWMWRKWPFAEDEVCCQRVEHIFIDFVAEVFGPLSCGVPINVVPYSVRRNPILLRDYICNRGVTRITLVPTLARLLVEATTAAPPTGSAVCPSRETPSDDVDATTVFCFDSVRTWVLSGKALPWSVARGLARLSLPSARLLNLYGSTEVAADVTFYSQTCATILMGGGERITEEHGERTAEEYSRGDGGAPSYPIGQPITNCGVELMEVVDLERASVAHDGPPVTLRRIASTEAGRVGMVYIYGSALSSGYWGLPAATEECFPSYTWDSAPSSYRLCSGWSTVHQAPESVPIQNLVDQEQGNSGQNGGEARESRDQRSVRFFRTGDLASFEPSQPAGGGDDDGDGWNLVYRGRVDQQVKINGQQLDLGEVEACLLRLRGVALAAAVAVCTEDAGRRQDGRGEDTLGSVGSSVVGVVVSPPQDVDEAMVLAKCRRSLPSFAVPQLVVVTAAIPTLAGSGKVDRREVKRVLLGEFHRRHGSDDPSTPGEDAAIPTGTGTCPSTEENDGEEIVDLIMAAVESTLNSHDEKQVEPKVRAQTKPADTQFFTEAGLSSVQAVLLLHELRRNFVSRGRGRGLCGRHTVSLIDLYSYPTARSLAQWLVSAPARAVTECKGKGGQARNPASAGSKRLTGDGDSNKERRDHESPIDGVTIHPMNAELWAETSALISSVFLHDEPLTNERFKHCRATIGPAGVAVVRWCHERIESRSLHSILQKGGRVLIATSDTTGHVVGFTTAAELVEPARGSGFLTSVEEGGVAEDGDWARLRSNIGAICTKWAPRQSCIDWLLAAALGPLMHPIYAIIDELMGTYKRDRGWEYAPGEVMCISKTGGRLDRTGTAVGTSNQGRDREQTRPVANGVTNDGDDGDNGGGGGDGSGGGGGGSSGGGGGGGGGFRAAVLVESMERRLLSEATDAGFIRALTLCTNTVTVHAAQELGFKEVARVSNIQTYRSPMRTTTYPRGARFPWINAEGAPRQGVSTVEHEGRPGPFARVSQDHAHVILFEKVLAPTVPLELFLDRHDGKAARSNGHREAPTANDPSATFMASPTDPSEYADVRVATSNGHELWKLVPVGRISSSHRCEMLAILEDSLPLLASSGRAVEYMAEDTEQGQVALVLLTAPLTASVPTGRTERLQAAGSAATAAEGECKPAGRAGARAYEPGGAEATGACKPAETQFDVLNGLLPVAPIWTVAACISWRPGGGASEPVQNGSWAGADKLMPSTQGLDREGLDGSGPSPSRPCRELLVLAVGRRWRCRGVGASLVHRFLAGSHIQGDSSVHVHSLPEAVGFYERHGFRRVRSEHADGKGSVAESTPPSDGKCVMVCDVARRFGDA